MDTSAGSRQVWSQHRGVMRMVLSVLVAGAVVAGAMGAPDRTPVAQAATGDPVIAAAGDIACDPANTNFRNGLGSTNSCHQKVVSDLLVGTGLSAVLLLGDNQYYCGGYNAFLQSYDLSWGRVKADHLPGRRQPRVPHQLGQRTHRLRLEQRRRGGTLPLLRRGCR